MPRLSVLDIIHRTVVYSLAGLTAWTVVSAVMIHRETLQKGRDLVARMEAEDRQKQEDKSIGPANASA
ncbi:hypothetical protein C8R41DRAFT_811314 [Lentinula lateritia]|uniref:CcmD family protein n=1 Tax=Lentinula lateritia TaxID=40482 RepID=A0ABQ8VVI8_9AGAR|nr:hypothetical protein C8R41DRAFT_811314 [Lentinula lateritia]